MEQHRRIQDRSRNGSRPGNGSVSKDSPSIILQGRSACTGPYRAEMHKSKKRGKLLVRSGSEAATSASEEEEEEQEEEEEEKRREKEKKRKLEGTTREYRGSPFCRGRVNKCENKRLTRQRLTWTMVPGSTSPSLLFRGLFYEAPAQKGRQWPT